MKKFVSWILCFVIIAGFFVSFSGALDLPEGAPLANETKYVQEVVDQKKWEYLGEAWQELLLDNKYIMRANALFTKMNPLFVILFAREYSFSVTMLFVFLLWLFTFLSLKQYKFMPKIGEGSSSEATNFVIALVATIILAHIKLFDYVAAGMFKLLFYKSSALWSLVTFVVLIILLILYLYVNLALGRYFKKKKEEKENKETRRKVSNQEEFNQTLVTQSGTHRLS